MTVLVSSHNLRELENICDHVEIIHKGKMVVQKPLDDIRGGIFKVQMAFEGEFPEKLKDELNMLSFSHSGSVYTAIIKGDSGYAESKISEYNPLIYDKVRLTLEEVFIYELGGYGYDIHQIIL